MNNPEPAATYWEQRWHEQNTGWDIGYASPPLTTYADGFPNKDAAILIPGCGSAHEARHLLQSGFCNITLLDISPTAIEGVRGQFQFGPAVKTVVQDIFEHSGTYDLILEQTFFCALPPGQRLAYGAKMASLLAKGGILAGVLFNRDFETPGPPFGGNEAEYRPIFEKFFTIRKMQPCYNSIPPRQNAELFIELVKR